MLVLYYIRIFILNHCRCHTSVHRVTLHVARVSNSDEISWTSLFLFDVFKLAASCDSLFLFSLLSHHFVHQRVETRWTCDCCRWHHPQVSITGARDGRRGGGGIVVEKKKKIKVKATSRCIKANNLVCKRIQCQNRSEISNSILFL